MISAKPHWSQRIPLWVPLLLLVVLVFGRSLWSEFVIWDDGELTKKTKKLIAISIAAAMRDQHAVRAQLAGAKNLGVTKAEIEEALRVTFLLSGMPAYVYGKAQLDEVMK